MKTGACRWNQRSTRSTRISRSAVTCWTISPPRAGTAPHVSDDRKPADDSRGSHASARRTRASLRWVTHRSERFAADQGVSLDLVTSEERVREAEAVIGYPLPPLPQLADGVVTRGSPAVAVPPRRGDTIPPLFVPQVAWRPAPADTVGSISPDCEACLCSRPKTQEKPTQQRPPTPQQPRSASAAAIVPV